MYISVKSPRDGCLIVVLSSAEVQGHIILQATAVDQSLYFLWDLWLICLCYHFVYVYLCLRRTHKQRQIQYTYTCIDSYPIPALAVRFNFRRGSVRSLHHIWKSITYVYNSVIMQLTCNVQLKFTRQVLHSTLLISSESGFHFSSRSTIIYPPTGHACQRPIWPSVLVPCIHHGVLLYKQPQTVLCLNTDLHLYVAW